MYYNLLQTESHLKNIFIVKIIIMVMKIRCSPEVFICVSMRNACSTVLRIGGREIKWYRVKSLILKMKTCFKKEVKRLPMLQFSCCLRELKDTHTNKPLSVRIRAISYLSKSVTAYPLLLWCLPTKRTRQTPAWEHQGRVWIVEQHFTGTDNTESLLVSVSI